MAQNIEVKCRVSRLAPVRSLLEQMGLERIELLIQHDTFFKSPKGRIKLRQIRDSQDQLIIYLRPDEQGFRLSDYIVIPVSEPDKLEEFLSEALGRRGVIRKTRELYQFENVRIHLDKVEILGEFVEFEAVQSDPEQSGLNREKVKKLMELLEIRKDQICSEAYIDMLNNRFAR